MPTPPFDTPTGPTPTRLSGEADPKGRVFTIGPEHTFLRTLAEAIVTGKLVDGFCPADDPLSLSTAIIYLPTRRAARGMGLALSEAMQAASGSEATLLPRIRTLGDMDEEESLDDIGGAPEDLAHFMQEAAKVIPSQERQLTLATLAKGWMDTLQPQERELFQREHVVLPSSSADALRLAVDLAAFMDQIETEETDPSLFGSIIPDDHAEWWALTARFLAIILENWPGHLAEKGKINPAQFRTQIAEFRISILAQRTDSSGPVIAAGSTGSIPATARLLTAIAASPKGAVVLPGFDLDLPETVVRKFSEDDELAGETASSSHPQFAMVRLLENMGIKPGEVKQLVPHSNSTAQSVNKRIETIQTALLPPAQTVGWHGSRQGQDQTSLKEAFENCALVEARNERNEAISIALILREALEDPKKTCALVTPDRDLARRVSGELERFGIGIDDSAGTPLINTESVRLCRNLLRVLGNGDHACWAAFFKGPLANLFAPKEIKHPGTLMELALIRDCLQLPKMANLAEQVETARMRIDAERHAHPLVKSLTEEQWLALRDWANALTNGLEPLGVFLERSDEISVGQLARALRACFENFGFGEKLNDLSGGQTLQDFLSLHSEDQGAQFRFPTNEAAPVFDVLLGGSVVRETARSHPRLQILGTLEARLQEFDRIVLGGLNEGVWPPNTRNDPFLNRPMRSQIGLPLPERRIGLAAHDFVQLSGHKEVFYTRSARNGDTPSIACRWLQRLETYAGDEVFGPLRERGNFYTRLADAIDKPAGEPIRATRAEAWPPVDARPKKLSITEIETWIRDPYAIYARHVLGLRPFPQLVRNADPALRGSLYHAIVADFVQTWQGAITNEAESVFETIADKHFCEASLAPEIHAMWRPRFSDVADAFLKWEMEWREQVAKSHCEVGGRITIGDTGFVLSGQADRIDELKDGQIAVIDYKTGQKSSGAIARTLDPQLALAGAMARGGAFKNVLPGNIGALYYVPLKADSAIKEADITRQSSKQLVGEDELADQMMERLTERIVEYNSPKQSYISRYAAKSDVHMSGDYDHLARVREWSIGEEESSGEDDA